jgi:hypothetical protein
MGLKGYRLWVMGQIDSTCRAPPRLERVEIPEPRGVAAHKSTHFEAQGFETRRSHYRLKGVKPGGSSYG